MWLQGQYWLWLIAISAALLMSAGFSVLALASSNEQRIRALTMLPLELQSGSPPSFLSRLLLMLLSVALVSFIGALIILAIIGPALFAIFGGLSLFLGKFLIQGWWTRSATCRPMKYVFSFSVALLALLFFAIADFCING
ncbi:hypothetical protein [Dokdonella fugitiva]|jgi:hypothetical protein|uniref:hypothetical protein n=1 Tax=Dokdonella fugitiva TaxID=328517 RepID=UPI00105345D2|nr:hypothetical protein [Dokdonella fugitiva]